MGKVNRKDPKKNRNEAGNSKQKVDNNHSDNTENAVSDSPDQKNSERARPGSAGGGGTGMKNLSLGTIKAVRKTTARMMKQYNKGNLSGEKFQKLLYGITILLQGFKAEVSQDLEARIEALEAYQNEQS